MKNASSDVPQVSICCDPEEFYGPESTCYWNTSFPLELVFPYIYDGNLSMSNMSETEFVPRYEMPCSNNVGDFLEHYPTNKGSFYLLENGTIYVNTSIADTAKEWLGPDDYCLLSFRTENLTTSGVFACAPLSSNETEGADTHLSWTVYGEDQIVLDTIYLNMVGISIPFLAATFLVYTILPELNNIPGLILRMYIACLLVAHTVSIVLVTNVELFCNYFTDITLQFAILSYCFWLNVMSFDIWWTLRSMRNSAEHRQRRKFVRYSIYAWGLPALITGAGAIIDSIPTLPSGVIRPGLRKGCWFRDDLAIVIYLYVPIEFTLVSNMIFFTLTAIQIFRHAKNTDQLLKEQSDETQRFKLYLKLFTVMGMTEIGHLIVRLWKTIPPFLRFIIDIPGGLQGLSIFIIFVCKENVIQLLLKRMGCRNLLEKNSVDTSDSHAPPSGIPTSCPMPTHLRSTETCRQSVMISDQTSSV